MVRRSLVIISCISTNPPFYLYKTVDGDRKKIVWWSKDKGDTLPPHKIYRKTVKNGLVRLYVSGKNNNPSCALLLDKQSDKLYRVIGFLYDDKEYYVNTPIHIDNKLNIIQVRKPFLSRIWDKLRSIRYTLNSIKN